MLSSPNDRVANPQERILELTMGFAVTQSIFAITKLGVADLINDAPRRLEELANDTHAHVESLYRFMRALTKLGIFEEIEDRKFKHTSLSRCLRTDAPDSMRDFCLLRETSYTCWKDVLHTLRTGDETHSRVYGVGFDEEMDQSDDKRAIFNRSMMNVAARQNQAILSAFDFQDCIFIVDLADGLGHRLAAILQEYPSLKGILLCPSSSLNTARLHIEMSGVMDRCTLVEGNLTDSIPTGGSIYLLDSIHRWNDEKARDVLLNCRQAIGHDSRLLVIERIVEEDTSWRIAFADLNMLVTQGGKIRTKTEYQRLLESAGYRLNRIIPTKSPISLLECYRSAV